MLEVAKRFVLMVSAVVLIAGMCSNKAFAEKKIGVFLWSEEKRYQEAKDAMLGALKKNGFTEPALKFTVENAGGNKARAAEISKKLSTEKYDLILVVGTTAAVALTKEVKNVPVVFSMVYDPVDSKIAADWKSSGNNTTGASPRVPMAKLVGGLKQLAPVKKLGVLYTPGEKNSETQLKELQAEQDASGVKIVPIPLTTKEDVNRILAEALSVVEAVFLSGSSIVGENVPMIVNMANAAKIVTVSHLEDYVEMGVMLGVCADPTAVGQLAGEKAAKVLKGERPAAIPIEALKKLDLIINMKTVKAAGKEVSPPLLKSATRIIQ